MARVQRAVGLWRALSSASAQQACAQAPAGLHFTRAYSALEPVSPPATYVDIEDEYYMRQRSMITLGNRHPNPAVGAWISPSAVVVGDVDIYDKVSSSRRLRDIIQPYARYTGLRQLSTQRPVTAVPCT